MILPDLFALVRARPRLAPDFIKMILEVLEAYLIVKVSLVWLKFRLKIILDVSVRFVLGWCWS